MPEWLRLLLYALAVVRVTHMLWWENGPFDVFDWLRAKAGISVSRLGLEDGFKNLRYADGFWAELLNCPLCLSVWLAVPATVAYWLNNTGLDIVAIWLAIACVSMFAFGWNRE